MIESLRIEQLALVEALELEFGPGLNVLTGETGAGKSTLLGALALLAGGRAPKDAVRSGASQALVEAVFRVPEEPELAQQLEAHGACVEAGALIVRRTLNEGGRSRTWLGGAQTPLSVPAQLFAGRIEVSSQQDSLALLQPDAQSRLLDRFGGLEAACAQVAQSARALASCLEERAALTAAAEEHARQEALLTHQVREIDEAELDAEALERTAAQRTRLAHAETLGEGAAAGLAALNGDTVPEAEGPGACARLAEAAREIERIAKLDDSLAPFAQRLAAAGAELADLAQELERYLSGLEADPVQLAGLEERLAQVEHLRRKYGGDLETILKRREEMAAELATAAGASGRLAELEAELPGREQALLAAAKALTQGRGKAARALSQRAQDAIRELALDAARFSVELEERKAPEGLPCGAAGAERAVFLFSANAGETLRPLRHVASGGERSRVFLALKNVLRRAGVGMVLVFDEVDAGIGGAVAERVGAMLGELARWHQVLCITHLPQIACHAERHFRVEKQTAQGRSVTRVHALSEGERVDEIARMAGGARISEATRRHARELLRAADSSKRR